MAGLPWIKVEVALPNHPKLEAFEGALGLADGLGVIIRLWAYVAAYYPGGKFPKASALTVEKAILRGLDVTYGGNEFFSSGGPPDAGEAISALWNTGWLDDAGNYWAVHDWEEFHAAHADKANKNRERQARFRQRQRALPARNAGVTRDVTPLE